MQVNKTEIKNFRNIKSMTFSPCGGVNVIFGENAQGKTNIIESLWLFSGLKSFRGARDSELISFGESFSRLQMSFENSMRENSAELLIEKKREAVFNGVKQKSAAALIGKFSCVVFSPSFMSIIKDGPGERRKFTDAAICQLKPAYAKLLSQYNRILQQRNSLLKDIQYDSALLSLLDCIDEKLAFTGEKILIERKKYLDALSPFVCDIYSGLSSGKEEISFSYIKKDSPDGKTALIDALIENRKKDIINKNTSSGPHRDDIDIRINGISVKSYGSQGQQRSCAIALKLGEAQIIKSETGENPVILLDDVMSELDENRQDYILNHISGRQVFISCCEPTQILRLCSGKSFYIEKGEIR